MINLDTHVLVHALEGRLKTAELELLDSGRWSVSAIVPWEIAKLVQLGRLKMDLDDPEVVRALSRIHVWPLDLAIARASTRLDFRGDPADKIIAATILVHGIPLVTRDRAIRSSYDGPGGGLTGARPMYGRRIDGSGDRSGQWAHPSQAADVGVQTGRHEGCPAIVR